MEMKQNWNKTNTKLKQNCFISADHRRHCSISVLFQRLAHVKQNVETVIVGVAWNNSETNLKLFRLVSVFYFPFISHVRAALDVILRATEDLLPDSVLFYM